MAYDVRVLAPLRLRSLAFGALFALPTLTLAQSDEFYRVDELATSAFWSSSLHVTGMNASGELAISMYQEGGNSWHVSGAGAITQIPTLTPNTGLIAAGIADDGTIALNPTQISNESVIWTAGGGTVGLGDDTDARKIGPDGTVYGARGRMGQPFANNRQAAVYVGGQWTSFDDGSGMPIYLMGGDASGRSIWHNPDDNRTTARFADGSTEVWRDLPAYSDGAVSRSGTLAILAGTSVHFRDFSGGAAQEVPAGDWGISHVTGMSSARVIVGNTQFESFVWREGRGFRLLNSLLTTSEWTLSSVGAIGDDGVIAGIARNNFDNRISVVKLTPVPEPASMAVLGIGLAAFRRRRRG